MAYVRPKVLIYAQNHYVRQGLSVTIDADQAYEPLLAGGNLKQLQYNARTFSVDIILLWACDLSPDTLLNLTRKLSFPTPIIAFIPKNGLPLVPELVGEGIMALLMEDDPPSLLFDAISTVLMKQEVWMSPKVMCDLIQHKPPTLKEALTSQEWVILREVGMGKNNKEIARLLSISSRTVQNHLSSLFRKLGVSSRTQAALWAWKHQLVVPTDLDNSH